MPTKTTRTTKVTKTTKAAPKKAAVKPAVKKAAKTVVAEKPTSLTISVVGVDGARAGTIKMPETLFDAKINKQLIAQAVRVYLANQRTGGAMTKTRGKVEGSTRKIYRQKGTGRARHGSIRAPIFVGGGIVFGPQTRDYTLKMPEKMKKAALASALTTQFKEGKVIVMDGLEALEPKTKLVAGALSHTGATGKTLLVVGKDNAILVRAARNIAHVDVVPMTSLNTYDVLFHAHVVFTKQAIEALRA